MRHVPGKQYLNTPCSYTSVGCACEEILSYDFGNSGCYPKNMRDDGYVTLEDYNRYVRSFLPVKKRVNFRRGERPVLRDFLALNIQKCCICVNGHFLYAENRDYWSFFDNDDDEVITVWYLKE